jgi:N-acetylglucosaminyldiphosphoundecaprenol N-acetyl-beta-D-mannosaminyltransferase
MKISDRLTPDTEQQGQRKTIDLLGVRIDVLDTAGLCQKLLDFAGRARSHSVMYVNADCMLIAQKNQTYKQTLNQADIVYADGVGVVLGVRLWGKELPGRSTGADFFPDFCRTIAEKGLRLYFLGARPGIAREAAERLIAATPGLMIVGTHDGYFKEDETEQVIAEINALEPDIVIIGFGAPKQELWIRDHAQQLKASVLWSVGGLFDFLSGNTPRGPQWMLDHGFEWLCRLAAEPGRLWRRYLLGNTKFVFVLLWHRFFVRETGR